MENFEYKKSLGQNFLIDQNIINKIINNINLKEDALIIEIGPGSGALTKKLIELKADVVCFEIDARLKETLSKIKSKNLEIIYEDFLKVDLKTFLSKKKFKHLYFIANLPYYITTSIINKIYDETEADEMLLMVQKEVADRFMAVPSTKEYNSLSVFLQYNYEISKVANVSKHCFYPRPKIDSTVVKFTKILKKTKAKDESKFYELVKASFKYKRKNLRNNLKGYDLDKISEVLKKSDKDLTFRAESLTIKEFIDISNSI